MGWDFIGFSFFSLFFLWHYGTFLTHILLRKLVRKRTALRLHYIITLQLQIQLSITNCRNLNVEINDLLRFFHNLSKFYSLSFLRNLKLCRKVGFCNILKSKLFSMKDCIRNVYFEQIGGKVGGVDELISLASQFSASTDPALKSLSQSLSLRQMIRIAKRFQSYPDYDLHTAVYKACLARYCTT